MAPPEKPAGPRRAYATVGEAVLHCRQPERGGKACWDAEQFDRHLVRGGDAPVPSEPLCPRETRVRALLTGEDHLRGGWRSSGRRETDLDALITHQLHTSSPMDSAAPIARSRSGAGPTGSGCEPHTHLAWLARLVALPLTLFAQWARAAVTVTSRIHHTQAPVSLIFAAPGGEAHGLLGTGGFRRAGEGSQRR